MQLRITGFALLIIISLHNLSLAQQPSQSPGQTPANSKPAQDTQPELRSFRREQAIINTRSFVADVLGMKDVSVKAITIAALADLIWNSDEPYARQLFSKALEFTSISNDPSSDSSKLSPSMLKAMRRQIIRRIARRDPASARRILNEELTVNGREVAPRRGTQVDIEIASDLLNDQPTEAVKFAERSLNSGLAVAPMTRLLKELRLKDEAAANELFLKTVRQVAADPDSKPNDLLLLGTYVFTSPGVNNSDPAAVAQLPVRGLSVYDITADRPNIPPALTRAYLRAAVEKLTRRTSDARQRPYYYIASYLMLPKLQKFAPDAAPRLAAAMQNLVPDIPQWVTQESSYQSSTDTTPKDFDAEVREVEKLPDVTERDVRYLMLGHRAWEAKDFKEARVCASHISNGDIRSRFNALIDFSEAAREFDRPRPNIEEVEKISDRLTDGTARSLLWLGVVRAHVSANEPQRAAAAVNAALKAARSIDGPRRPYLILNAAGQITGPDPAFAQQLLVEAVKGLNEQDEQSLKQVEWQEWVKFGPLALEFPLDVKGINLGLDDALRRIAQSDVEGTTASVRMIKDERNRAEALVDLTAALLEWAAKGQE